MPAGAPGPDLPAAPRGRRGWPWDAPSGSAGAPPPGGWPRITVVTPSFGQARWLEATIRSVLLQGYPALEYFVLDGGSTDGSAAVVERYAPWLSGWRSAPDGGQSQAINEGFEQATGEILAWLNSDDRYLPGTLAEVARFARAHPSAAAWVGACRGVDAAGRELRTVQPLGVSPEDIAAWTAPRRFSQPACFFSRRAALAAGHLDEALESAFDVEFFLRLAAQGALVEAPGLWAEETVHPDAKTQAHPGRSLAELHLAQLRHGHADVALAQMTQELEELWRRRRTTVARHAWEQLQASVRAWRGRSGA